MNSTRKGEQEAYLTEWEKRHPKAYESWIAGWCFIACGIMAAIAAVIQWLGK